VPSYTTLLVVAAFFSISVYEGLVILGLLALFIKRDFEKGLLAIPVVGFITSTTVSTALYFPKMFLKSLGEGLFQAVYFFKVNAEEARTALAKMPYLLVFLGLLGLPFLVNNAASGSYKVFWGGVFEAAQFYTIFSFAAFLIAVKELKSKGTLSADAVFYLLLFGIFLSVVILSQRRSYLLAVPVTLVCLLILLKRNGLVSSRFIAGVMAAFLIGGAGAYYYLSVKDVRFKTLNEVLLGQRKLDERTMNVISSIRYNLLVDGLNIIRKDVEEGRLLHILIGHGIRAGLYLPHEKSPKNWERYESILFVSELVERGIVGVLSITLIGFLSLKKFLSVRVEDESEIVYLVAFIPLMMHFVASIFTFFWDALLPLYLLLFKLGERAFRA